ncbi:MAG: type II CAAX endopeptidase family protein [Ardenticatenales bacterium]
MSAPPPAGSETTIEAMTEAQPTMNASTPTSSNAPLVRAARAHPLLAFFALAYAGSWTAIAPVLLSRTGLGVFDYALPGAVGLALYLVVAPMAGPGLAAFAVTYSCEGRDGVRRLLGRCLQWRVPPFWGVVALFVVFGGSLISAGFTLGLGPVRALADAWPMLVTVFVPTAILLTVLGLFGEEPGWRGFALPRLQARWGPVGASAVVGLLHSLWYLPAFFVQGALAPYSPPRLAAFVLTGIAASLAYTWIYNHGRGSVLLLTAMHAAGNAASAFVGRFLVPPDRDLRGVGRAFHEQGWDNMLAFALLAGLLLVFTLGRLGLGEEDEGDVDGLGAGS